MSVTPTGQPDKEGSDKNVGNPDTTLNDINITVAFTIRQLEEMKPHEDITFPLPDDAMAAIQAYTAKAVREARIADLNWVLDNTFANNVTDVQEITDRIEQLKQEGGDK